MAVSEGDGNGWVVSDSGDRRWGRFGAAGLLLRAADPTDPDIPLVLLQHRAVWTASGDTWALPGGARDSFEDAAVAALRETEEEAEIRPADVVVRAERVTSRMPGTVWHRPGLDLRHVARMMSRLRPDQTHPESDDGHDDDVQDDDVQGGVQDDDDNATTHGTDTGGGAGTGSGAGARSGSRPAPSGGSSSGGPASGGAPHAPSGQPAAPTRGRPRIPPLVQVSEAQVEWTYTTVVADAPSPLETVPNNESLELRWVPETRVAELPLMPAFAAAWADGLRTEPVELVVDVANVLGSRPDGWWKDRAGATSRLLDELGNGMPRTLEIPAVGPAGSSTAPDGAAEAPAPTRFGWVARAHAVIEGAARAAEHSGPFVVHRAAGSGDDAIVDLVTELDGGTRRVVVVTADRGLRARLPEGVVVVGPRALLS